MREWNSPSIEELEISSTNTAFETGTVPDSYHHDNITGVEKPFKYFGNSGIVAE